MARTSFRTHRAFSLIELLVVIAVISVLMTAAAVGINNLGGKGVTSAVSNAEAIFDEARATAKSRSIRSCVLVAKSLDNNPQDDLRRMVVAYEEVDPVTGEPTAEPDDDNITWVLSSRGAVFPERVFFSEELSRRDHQAGGEGVPIVTLPEGTVKPNYVGDYFIYQFNSEGVAQNPGTSFVIGAGVRPTNVSADEEPPRVTGKAKRDFGGFVVWRNGGTSVFRSVNQITETVPSPGDAF
ncbi:MAG: type II secretion system protein [Akkermansiaceae bacterium]|nr:type II secretion system protein [Akkermansiaceae bacterium]